MIGQINQICLPHNLRLLLLEYLRVFVVVFLIKNLTIYYNAEQLKKRDFCGSDFFVVLDTEKRPRKSWVVWGEQGKYPDVIVEILSDSTANIDRNNKKILYR